MEFQFIMEEQLLAFEPIGIGCGLGAVIYPMYIRPGAIIAESFFGTPIVANRHAIGGFVEIDIESTKIGGIFRRIDLVDDIVFDGRTRHIGKRVDATSIIKHLRETIDLVATDVIVLHAGVERRPSPAHANAGIIDITDDVVFDDAVGDIAGSDADTSPILVGDVLNQIISNEEVGTKLTHIDGAEGNVCLEATIGESSKRQGCTSNVVEVTTLHHAG